MGVGGIFKFFFRRFIEIFFLSVLLVLIPNLPPNAKFTKPFTVPPAKPFTGKLALNNRLNDIEIWHKGDFIGPEAFTDLNGELYTSLHSGDIVKLTGEHITPVVKFGKPCKHSYEERICGRPLGMAFDKNGYLVAADSYYGIFKVNVKTGDKEQLVSPKTVIEGKAPKLFNSVALASNGDIYWTESTNDFLLEDGAFSLLADPSGRLIHYDAKTKRNKVLVDDLHFANGVALSDDEEFVIVAETGRDRIHRYYLKGLKKGTQDIFIDGLPGLPDNLKADGKGGFFVPLVTSKDNNHPALFQSIGPFPLLRKAIARFFGITQYVFKKSEEYFPNEFSAKAVHMIGHFSSASMLFQSDRLTLLRVNKNGEITDSVHTLNKKISSISDMHVFRDTLYLGSPFNDYIARIPLAKLGWDDLQGDRVKRAAPVETPKPTQAPKPTTTKPTTTTPKPTTTTPKPTTTTPKPTTTTPKPTTTTQKPTTTTPKPTTTAPKQTTTTPKPTTTTPKPTTTTPKPTTQKPVTIPPKQQQAPPKQQQAPPQQQQAPPQARQAPPAAKQAAPQASNPPPKQQTPPPVKQQAPQGQQQPKQATPTKEQPKPTQAKQQGNQK